MKKTCVFGFVYALLFCSFCGCENKVQPYSQNGFALDTAVSFTVYTTSQQKADTAFSALFSELFRLENLLSATIPTSDIARINAEKNAIVSPETVALLTVCQEVSARSNGALDITVRPVSKLWQFNSRNPAVPAIDELKTACQKVDYRQLHINDNGVILPDGYEIEPGGVAKGYIADCLRVVLQQQGIHCAIIDLGGNIVTVGNKQGENFAIGIKNPQNTTSLKAIVKVVDCAVVTSGNYERCFIKDGVRYHHILNPKTGFPIQNTLASVTILCHDSALADALSTACFVLGEDKAKVLLSSYENTSAVFIRQDGSIETVGLQTTEKQDGIAVFTRVV